MLQSVRSIESTDNKGFDESNTQSNTLSNTYLTPPKPSNSVIKLETIDVVEVEPTILQSNTDTVENHDSLQEGDVRSDVSVTVCGRTIQISGITSLSSPVNLA